MTNIAHRASARDKMLVLAAICLSALVLPLSFTGGAVATPAIGRDLGGSAVALTWITNAFMLTFGSLLMAAGALADVYGRKRVFAIGMMLFTAASLAQSLAPSVFWLDILRAVQGVAGAAALASGSAALAQEFDGHARTRAFSMLGTTFGIGLAFGPLVAGGLIEAFSWRAIFVFTGLIGIIAMVFGLPRMRETRDPGATGLDWPGTITFSGVLALFTFGVIQALKVDGVVLWLLACWSERRSCSRCSSRSRCASNVQCSTSPCSAIRDSSACRCCLLVPAIATSCSWSCCHCDSSAWKA